MTDPLFVENVEVLKGKLRLSNIPDGKAAEAQLDESILRVREGFYLQLGKAKVDSLLAIPFNQNFNDHNGSLRALANSTEVKWILHELSCLMPVLFMDSQSLRQAWNEEGAFRNHDIVQLRSKLMNEVQEALLILQEGGINDQTGWRISDIGPDETPHRPNDSLRPLNVLNRFE